MRSALAFAVAALFLWSCEVPPLDPDGGLDAGLPDGGRAPVRVKVATFNVRLFFDTVCESGACSSTDFEQVATPAAFDARAAQLAAAIQRIDPDVIALQELETQASLDALLGKLDGGLRYGALGELGTAGSVDVAVLSRTPLELAKGWRNLTRLERPDGSRTSFSRELLEARVRAPNGVPVVLFAAHFRSKSPPDDPGRRLAEAQTSRQVVSDVAAGLPDALVVLAGDLNDTPSSPPLLALTADGGLLRAAADLPVASQATYVFNGVGEAIDHLLQAPTPAATLVPMSAFVWKESRGYGGSDHYALSAVYEVR